MVGEKLVSQNSSLVEVEPVSTTTTMKTPSTTVSLTTKAPLPTTTTTVPIETRVSTPVFQLLPTTSKPIDTSVVSVMVSVNDFKRMQQQLDNLTFALQKLRRYVRAKNNSVKKVSRLSKTAVTEPEIITESTTITTTTKVSDKIFQNTMTTSPITENVSPNVSLIVENNESTSFFSNIGEHLSNDPRLIAEIVLGFLFVVMIAVFFCYFFRKRCPCEFQRCVKKDHPDYEFVERPIEMSNTGFISDPTLVSTSNSQAQFPLTGNSTYQSNVTLIPYAPKPSPRYSSLPKYREVCWLQVKDNDLSEVTLHPSKPKRLSRPTRPAPPRPQAPSRNAVSYRTLEPVTEDMNETFV